MACPICDQKPANCDCTETEKRQWSEIEDLRLTDEERTRLSDATRDAVRALLDAHVPADTPILVPGAALDRRLEWLGRAATA